MISFVPILLNLSALLLLPQCQTVPATGEAHLTLISTAEEIQLGREADAQIRATMGIYQDQRLQDHLGELGLKTAKVSERHQYHPVRTRRHGVGGPGFLRSS